MTVHRRAPSQVKPERRGQKDMAGLSWGRLLISVSPVPHPQVSSQRLCPFLQQICVLITMNMNNYTCSLSMGPQNNCLANWRPESIACRALDKARI